jgi:OOP family OmpA-OmpF porin
MKIKSNKLVALIVPVALVSGVLFSSQGVAADMNHYLVDSSKSVVKNSAGQCWLTIGGMAGPLAECGDLVDTDGDGVTDDKDVCPGTPKGAPVDEKGCPRDSDGDGIPDYLDKCPGTPKGTRIDKNGCEIVAKKPAKVVIDSVLLFDFDSAALKESAVKALNAAFALFKGNQDIDKVMITGHTDSVGSDAYNQGLSERRANAVRSYLVNQGADGNMLEAKGMGESKPVASNDTKEGRAKNRRVEFDAVMK